MNDYRTKPKQLTTSHKLLYVILVVYVFVAVFCGVIIALLLNINPDSISPIMIPYLSYATVCGTSTITCYCLKAKEENKLQIQLSKYKMKIELAKQIYHDINSNNLDDKSIELIKNLSESESHLNDNFSSNLIEKIDQNGLG